MPIVSLTRILDDARRGGYGICYCESWNLESLQAVVEAAEECASPVIAGFNGGFLRHATRAKPERLAYYAGFRMALERSHVPIGFLLNESDDVRQIEEGIELGFNGVMVENEGLRLDEYEDLVHAVVERAHARNVWVEAQIGVLPSGEGGSNGHAELTNPDLAQSFVEATRVDALGIAVGNVHILTEGRGGD
jgi:tagatose 1,6-diphosphate aldolase GatY/KbaY